VNVRTAVPPRGYVAVRARHGTAIVKESESRGVAEILERGTLYAHAATHPDSTRYRGRLPAFGIPLPHSATRVVVRHATHGGMLAWMTGDRFIGAGRAPHELEVAHALRDAGVPTPELVGYALYRGDRFFSRIDVVTSEVPDALDLATVLGESPNDPRPALEATARLIAALASAGAHHADLNLKNVLIVQGPGGTTASVLDVDRVTLGLSRGDAMKRNLARFERSARKWLGKGALAVSELDLRWLAGRAKELAA
jgi:3-deoxy-D-manno-octulosonic acid kinase